MGLRLRKDRIVFPGCHCRVKTQHTKHVFTNIKYHKSHDHQLVWAEFQVSFTTNNFAQIIKPRKQNNCRSKKQKLHQKTAACLAMRLSLISRIFCQSAFAVLEWFSHSCTLFPRLPMPDSAVGKFWGT